MHNTAEMFSFGPNPTRAKKALSSSTCLLYAWRDFYTIPRAPQCLSSRPKWVHPPPFPQANVSPPDQRGVVTLVCG
jgi:hypothetical protein